MPARRAIPGSSFRSRVAEHGAPPMADNPGPWWTRIPIRTARRRFISHRLAGRCISRVSTVRWDGECCAARIWGGPGRMSVIVAARPLFLAHLTMYTQHGVGPSVMAQATWTRRSSLRRSQELQAGSHSRHPMACTMAARHKRLLPSMAPTTSLYLPIGTAVCGATSSLREQPARQRRQACRQARPT
jgi:hypothetical protein